MPSLDVNKKYVSKKIKSIRWKPAVMNNASAEIFVSGSWDDKENNISVWHLNDVENEPVLLQEISHPTDINDIQYITRDLLATGTGDGSILLFEHKQSGLLECKHRWARQHKLRNDPVPSTALASNGEQVASVGEDGKLIILSPSQNHPIKVIESNGGCSDYAVLFIKAAEVLTGNMQGHLKLWDLRAQSHVSKLTLLSPDQVSVNHLAKHPTQQHLIAAAGEDGALALWDMRSTNQPIALITAHKGSITEVQFHPSASDHLFSCGFDGQVLHWDASASSRIPSIMTSKNDPKNEQVGSTNAWFTSDVACGAIDAVSLVPASYLPINSLNIDSDTLLAGSDNEAIFVIKNVLF